MSRPPLLLALALVACLGVSWLAPWLDPYLLEIVIGIGISVILAVSLNLVNGHTGQFSLGHAGFMAVGAYLSSCCTVFLGPRVIGALGDHALVHAGLFLGALLVGGACAAIAGFVVGVPSLRLRGDYLAIVTLGFGEIIRVIFQNLEGVGGALGFIGMPAYTTIFWVFGAAVVTIYVVACLVNSTYGRGFLATHDDEIAAEAIGVNTTRYKITAFVIGAFFAGIAGGLYAHHKLTINPQGFDFSKSIEIVVMVILGGMGRTGGVILAAILLTTLPEVLRPVAEFRMILYALLLIVLMLARPQGLFNRAGRKA